MSSQEPSTSTSTSPPSSNIQLIPPFTYETAKAKVKKAQAAWNTRNPEVCAKAYTEDSIWRNRDKFFSGREKIIEFLTEKWKREGGYRLRKELFCWEGDRIAVQFWYEYCVVEGGQGGVRWFRTYGLEDWTFNSEGLMKKRMMSANEIEISEGERWFSGEVGEGGVDALVDKVEIGEMHW